MKAHIFIGPFLLVAFLWPHLASAQNAFGDACRSRVNNSSNETGTPTASAPGHTAPNMTVPAIGKKYPGGCTCRGSYSPVGFAQKILVNVPDDFKNPIYPADLERYDAFEGRNALAYMFCTDETLAAMHANGDIGGEVSGRGAVFTPPSTAESYIVPAINGILWVIARALLWILYYLSLWVGELLRHGSFITDPFVQGGWPFILGIANLGFVLALLFIAAATTLNLSGFSARRMLPKLLLAALLVNFSLIIAGAMVDVTRIIMAAMTGFLTNGRVSLNTIGYDVLKASQTLEAVVTYTAGGENVTLDSLSPGNRWPDVLLAFKNAFLIGVITVGFAILAVGLLIRHITLLMLLVISPLAYLALAFPGLGKYATMWWQKFITQLIYGPAALLVLILISVVGGYAGGGILSIIFTAVLLGAAAKLGKTAGTIGGAALVGGISGYVSGKATGLGRGLGRGALGVPGVALRGAQAIPIAGVPLRAPAFIRGVAKGVGARFGQAGTKAEDKGFELTKPKTPILSATDQEKYKARRQLEQATDLGMDIEDYQALSPAEQQSRLRALRGLPPLQQSQDGTPQDGQQPGATGGTQGGQQPSAQGGAPAIPQAQAVSTPVQPIAPFAALAQQAQAVFQQVADGTRPLAQALQDPALQGTNLRHTAVKQALGAENIAQVVGNSNNGNQIQAIIEDQSYVQGLSDQDLARITQALYNNPNFDGDRKANLLDRLHQRIT